MTGSSLPLVYIATQYINLANPRLGGLFRLLTPLILHYVQASVVTYNTSEDAHTYYFPNAVYMRCLVDRTAHPLQMLAQNSPERPEMIKMGGHVKGA
jgi:hypothetical protein